MLLPRGACGLAGAGAAGLGAGGAGAALALGARLARAGGGGAFAVAPEPGALGGAVPAAGLEVRFARDYRPDPGAGAAGYPFEAPPGEEAPEAPFAAKDAEAAAEALARWLSWGWSGEALGFLEALRASATPAGVLAVLRGGEHLAVPLGDVLGVPVVLIDTQPHRRSAAEGAAASGRSAGAAAFLLALERRQMELANGLARLLDLPLRYTLGTWRERLRCMPRLLAAPRPVLQGLQHSIGSLMAAEVPAVAAGGLLGPLRGCSCRESRHMLGRIYGHKGGRAKDSRVPSSPRCAKSAHPGEPPMLHCAVDGGGESPRPKTVCVWWDVEELLRGLDGDERQLALSQASEVVFGALHNAGLKAVLVSMTPGGESAWSIDGENPPRVRVSSAASAGSVALAVEHLKAETTPRYRALVDYCAENVQYATVRDLSGLCEVLDSCDALAHHGTPLDADLVLTSGKPVVVTPLPSTRADCGLGAVLAAENDFVAQILEEFRVAVRTPPVGVLTGLLLGRHLRDAATNEHLQDAVCDLRDFCIMKDRGASANVTAFLSRLKRQTDPSHRTTCAEVRDLAVNINENHNPTMDSSVLSNREIASSGHGLKAEHTTHNFSMFGLKLQWTSRVGEQSFRFGAVSNRL